MLQKLVFILVIVYNFNYLESLFLQKRDNCIEYDKEFEGGTALQTYTNCSIHGMRTLKDKDKMKCHVNLTKEADENGKMDFAVFKQLLENYATPQHKDKLLEIPGVCEGANNEFNCVIEEIAKRCPSDKIYGVQAILS